ncbi:C2 domain containing protein [Nitzschia inconspicua]|uniref:C2 domain containing protein n=1 Tax=Nitzschia inconspicua TaxID=303405 RepID=A0A9K3K4Z8_9STRA|nr:C2 domain containing protein [Nitzschia inconspicua]KAG7375001.1 C2 domain containing protein [Nitzschia inconspicua]
MVQQGSSADTAPAPATPSSAVASSAASDKPSSSSSSSNNRTTTNNVVVSPLSLVTTTSAAAADVTMKPRFVRTWNVKMPPAKKKVVGGVWTPTLALPMIARKRRITIEIYKNSAAKVTTSSTKSNNNTGSSIRSNNSNNTSNNTTTKDSVVQQDDECVDLCAQLKDDDFVVVRILTTRRRSRWNTSRTTNNNNNDSDSEDDGDDDDDSALELDEQQQQRKQLKMDDKIKDKTEKKNDKKTASSSIHDAFHTAMAAMTPSNLRHHHHHHHHNNNNDDEDDDEWVEYRRYYLEAIAQEERSNHVFEATFGLGNRRERRELKFESVDAACDFQQQLDGLRGLVKQRTLDRLEAYKAMQSKSKTKLVDSMQQSKQGTENSRITTNNALESVTSLNVHTHITLLVEIVSAQDLPVADRTSSDPYVSVYLGPHKIHKTKPYHNELNPVWTVDTGSLFLVDCVAEEFFSYAAGLMFRIIDNDRVGINEEIGKVTIRQTDLLQMNGERLSFPIQVSPHLKKKKNVKKLYPPKLNLRVRKATPHDKTFVAALSTVKRFKRDGMYAEASFVPPHKPRLGLLRREVKTVDGVKLYRAKPGPDPTRPKEETEWMDRTQINEECMKPSYEWIESGTGKLGKMYVEILKCDGLPNLDVRIPGSSDKGLTDAFCCLVFEDTVVNTDVVPDDLNPRWMPWSQRAFVFRIAHPSSQLQIGVFDFDVARGGLNSHDPAGRITVDVTNFSPLTEYVLSYNIYESVLDDVRQPRGKITIRLRIEYDSFQKFSIGALTIRPKNHVNIPYISDFKAAYYTCNGEENMQRYSMQALTAYRTELESLVGILYFVRSAILTVLFWRGQRRYNFFGWKAKLPLHSVFAFFLGVTLVENLNLLPSYCLFCVSWLLVATNEERLRDPSPWHASLTVLQMWNAFLTGKVSPVDIAEYENEAAIRAYEEEMERRMEEEQQKQKDRQAAAKALSEFLDSDSTPPEDVDAELETKLPARHNINPLAVYILPIQQILGQICKAVRIVRSVLMWDESYLAFIIWNACFLVGLIFLFVPWHFLARWTARILVWTILGPWMKLVDWFVLPWLLGTNMGKDDALQKLAKEQLENLGIAKEAIIRKREEIMKERALKRYMFGKYAIKVPRYKTFRYRDNPLPESHATSRISRQEIRIKKRIHGQSVEGDMVPTWGDALDADIARAIAAAEETKNK